MAFTSAVIQRPIAVGNKKQTWGTYTSDGGSTGGDVDTGLRVCEGIFLQPKAAAVSASAPVYNETLPCLGNAVTIVTIANEVGTWWAMGD